jgi:hypothetical protein
VYAIITKTLSASLTILFLREACRTTETKLENGVSAAAVAGARAHTGPIFGSWWEESAGAALPGKLMGWSGGGAAPPGKLFVVRHCPVLFLYVLL